MYHAACKVEFQPFNRSYSQLTIFNFLQNRSDDPGSIQGSHRSISFIRIKHRTRANDNLCKCLMYHAACKVEFQPFTRSYSQLTFFNFLFKKIIKDDVRLLAQGVSTIFWNTWFVVSCHTYPLPATIHSFTCFVVESHKLQLDYFESGLVNVFENCLLLLGCTKHVYRFKNDVHAFVRMGYVCAWDWSWITLKHDGPRFWGTSHSELEMVVVFETAVCPHVWDKQIAGKESWITLWNLSTF